MYRKPRLFVNVFLWPAQNRLCWADPWACQVTNRGSLFDGKWCCVFFYQVLLVESTVPGWKSQLVGTWQIFQSAQVLYRLWGEFFFYFYLIITSLAYVFLTFLFWGGGEGVWVRRNVVTFVIQFPVRSYQRRHANEAKGSIQLRIDPFASFVCLSKQRNIFYSQLNSNNNHGLDSSVSRHRGSCRGHGFESRWSQFFFFFQALFSQPSKFHTRLRWSLIFLNTNIL